MSRTPVNYSHILQNYCRPRNVYYQFISQFVFFSDREMFTGRRANQSLQSGRKKFIEGKKKFAEQTKVSRRITTVRLYNKIESFCYYVILPLLISLKTDHFQKQHFKIYEIISSFTVPVK